MKLRPDSATLWSISVPLMFAGIGETIIDVTDTLFLAAYGTLELGAVAVADSLYELLAVLTIGIAQGCQVIVARRTGEGRHRRAGRVFNQTLQLLLVAAACIFLAVRYLLPLCTSWLVSGEEVRAAVDAFLGIIAFGVFFEAGMFAFGAFFAGISRTRVLIGSTAILAVTNVALDYGLIFGNFGLPEMGIEGAALGSVVADGAALVFLVLFAFGRGYVKRYRLFRRPRHAGLLSAGILTISYPLVLEGLIETARWLLFFLIVERIGQAELAASNLVYAFFTVFLIPTQGFAETVETVVGNLLGQGRARAIWIPIWRATKMCALVSLPLALPSLLFPGSLLGMLTDDPTIVAVGASSLFVLSLAVAFIVPGEMLLGALVGSGDTHGALLIELAITSLVLIYTWFAAMQLELSLVFLWLVVPVAWILRNLLAYARLRSGRWLEIQV